MSREQAKAFGIGLVFLVISAGASETFREDFAKPLGFWGGVIGGTLVASILIFALCLALKTDWRQSLGLAVAFPLTVNAFGATRELTDPSIGAGSIAVGGIVAIVLGGIVMAILTRMLGISWVDNESDSKA